MRLAVSRLVLKRRCHQGPLLGPHPHMKNIFLMVGPQCICIYVYIYIYWLVVLTPLKMLKVNGKDDIPYMKWKIKNVPNHQPVYIYISNICFNNSVWFPIKIAYRSGLHIPKLWEFIARLNMVNLRYHSRKRCVNQIKLTCFILLSCLPFGNHLVP